MSDLGKNSTGLGFVSSKAAAEAFGVTNDYVARLCRSGKVRGVLEGRAWFVEMDSLKDFFGREPAVRPGEPIKIYYKESAEKKVARVSPGQIAENPAILSVCPMEAQGHVGIFFIPKRHEKKIVRGAILGILLLATGTLGFGSYQNYSPAYAAGSSAQVAAAADSGMFSGVSGTARAIARTVDTIMYNLLYPRSETMQQIVVVHSDRQQQNSAPVAVAPVVKETVQQPVTRTVITNPVVERIIERATVVNGSGISEAYFQSGLVALENRLRAMVSATSASGFPLPPGVSTVIAQTNRIDMLSDADITDSRIKHSTISDSTFVNATLSGTTTLSALALGNATSTAGGGFDISSGCFAINGTCISAGGGTPGGVSGQVQFNDNGTFSGVATFTYATTTDLLHITNASTTNLSVAGGITGAGLASCSGSLDKLQYDSSSRQFVCAADQTGGGSGTDVNWSFFNGGALRPSTTTNQVLIGGVATSTNAKLQVIGGAVIDNATSTTFATNLLGIGGSSFTSLTGSGLSGVGGVLTVNQGAAFSTTSVAYWDSTQARWATTSTDYWRSQTDFYSTSSADFWKTQNNFFSTTSASAFLLLNQGNAFSTTSVAYYVSNGLAFSTTSSSYFLGQNQGVAFSTTSASHLLSTYDRGSFFSTTSVNYWEGTQLRWATTSSDAWLATKSFSQFSTTSADFWKTQNNFYSTSSASFFAANGLSFSTTSANFYSSVGLAFSTSSASYFLAQNTGASFSTTSTDYWKTQNSFFSTTSVNYWDSTQARWATTSADFYKSQNNFHSTTSFAFNLSTYDRGSFFSTTSVNYWEGTQTRWATTSSDYWLTTKSLSAFSTTSADYWKTQNNFFSTSSASFFASQGLAFSTTSANFYSSVGLAFSTTSAGYFLSQNTGTSFSTTSVAYWDSTQARWATTSSDYWQSQRNFYSTSSANFWKTTQDFFSTTSASAFLALNQGNAFSTTSAAFNLSTYDKGYFFSTTSAAYNLSTYDRGLFFSTTSVNYWEGTQTRWATTSSDYWLTTKSLSAFSTTSADYWKTQNNFFSTSSASFFTANGLAFSTTSANFYSSVGLAFSTTSASYFLSQNQGAGFSTTSASYFSSLGLAFSTTSTDYWRTQNNFFSTSSASFFAANGLAFSTTSADYYVHSSSTIPKTYSTNTFGALNVFSTGILSPASTTIGNGTQTGGLTVSGGATTTGNLAVAGTARINSTFSLGGVLSCTGAQALQTDGSGNVSCGTINTGGNSSAGGWTTNNVGRVTLSTTTDLVVVGASTTPYAKFAVVSGNAATTTLALVAASGQSANVLDVYDSTGVRSTVLTAAGNLGLGTSSPFAKLSVEGNGYINGTLSATGQSTFAGVYASSVAVGTTSLTDLNGTSAMRIQGTNATDILNLTNGIVQTGFFASTNDVVAQSQIGTVSNSNLGFFTNNATPQFVLKTGGTSYFTGNVGIGTTTPGSRLHVQAANGTDANVIAEAAADTGSYFTTRADISGGTSYYRGLMGQDRAGVSKWLVGQYGMTDDTSLGFYTNGTNERARITTAGNLGIGTTTPLEKLDVQGSIATDGYLKIRSWNDAEYGDGTARLWYDGPGGLGSQSGFLSIGAGTDDQMVLTNDGSVGIGTTTPNYKLDVAGASASRIASRVTNTNASGWAEFILQNDTANDYASMWLNGTARANDGGPNALTLFNDLGMIRYGSTGDQLWLTSGYPGTERMRLTNAGNLGVGSSSPFARVSIGALAGETNTALFAISSSTANSTTTLFSVSNTGSTTIANGINITSGCYAVNGTCISAGDGTFSTTSALYFSSLGLAFSTTSTDYWKTQSNFFSTTSALFFSSVGLAHSTTSVAYQLTQTPVMTNGFTAFASSTIGNGTATGGLTISGGATTTGSFLANLGTIASSTFVVGANGYTNPAFQVLASTTGAATGLTLTSNSAGNGVGLTVTSSGTNEAFSLRAKGSGNITLTTGSGSIALNSFGNDVLSVLAGGGGVQIAPASYANNSIVQFSFTGAANTGINAGTEVPDVSFNIGQVKSHSNGNIALQRSFRILAPTEAMTSQTSTNNFGDLATLGISGAPMLGNFATSTNNHTLLLGSSALNASTTNSYGITVNANTGAQNNYAAQFLGGNVGVGTSSPYAKLSIHANNGETNTSLFAIASSTSNSTAALFSVSNTGSTTIANGVNITSGCYAVNGACLSANGFFSTTSASYFASVGLAFSTTSTDYWKTQNNFYSTTSANFWASQGLAFSTTSDAYFASVGRAHSTTSVAYQLTQPVTLGNATSTNFFATLASSTNLATLNGTSTKFSSVFGQITFATNTSLFATTASSSAFFSNSGIFGSTTVGSLTLVGTTTSANGFNIASGCYAINGTCLSAGSSASSTLLNDFNVFNNRQQFNGGLLSLASSTIGNGTALGGLTISGNATTTGSLYVGTTTVGGGYLSFAPNSGTFQTGVEGVSQLSFDGFAKDFQISTGGVGLDLNGNTGVFSVTGSGSTLTFNANNTTGDALNLSGRLQVAADGNGTTTLTGLQIFGNATSSSDVGFNLSAGCFAINRVCVGNDGTFSTTSALYYSSLGLAFSTTSTDYWKTQNNFYSTTSANFWASQGLAFSTTSSDFWASTGRGFSSTSASYFLGQNTGNAFSTTSANFWSSAGLGFSTTSNAYFASVGRSHSTTSVAYQLTQTPALTGGFTAYSSSTIGNSTATGGLTISGAATTTGNAYFGGIIGATSSFSTTTVFTLAGRSFIQATTSANGLLAIGVDAGSSLIATSSSFGANTVFGYQSLAKATSSSFNTAFGYQTLNAAGDYSARSNTAVGYSALKSLVTGSQNVALGTSAASLQSGGNFNVAIGASSGSNSGGFTHNGNTSIGYAAGFSYQSGGNNTVIGHQAGSGIANGFSNTVVGDYVTLGSGIVGGSSNIAIGSHAFLPSNNASNQLNIGNIIYGTLPATTTAFALPTTGTIGIGTTSPTSKFGIAINAGDTLTTLFQISSSTSNSTTTLFSVSNTGSTTIANGVNITAGCFSISGVCQNNASGFSTTSALYYSSLGLAFSTTSSDYWKTQNNFYSTTSANYWANQGLSFSTTSANFWSSVGLAFSTTSDAYFASVGRAHSTTSVAYQLTQTPALTGGLTAYASSTIGNGTAIGGLTISGGATTTGMHTFYSNATAGFSSGMFVSNGENATAALGVQLFQGGSNLGAVPGWYNNASVLESQAGGLILSAYNNNGGITLQTDNRKPVLTAARSGAVGIGSTTPFAKLSIHTSPTDASQPTTLFAIASSTSNSTTTLFTVSNTGSTTIANGINITAGCYAVNGTCLIAGANAASSTLFSDFNTFAGTNRFTNGLQASSTSLFTAQRIYNTLSIATSSATGALTTSASTTVTGAEMVTNGTFTGNASGWTLGAGAIYGSNQIDVACGATCSQPYFSQDISFTAGQTYQVQYDVINPIADAPNSFLDANVALSPVEPHGHVSYVFTADFSGVDTFTIASFHYSPNSSYSIDNVSIKPVSYKPSLRVFALDGSSMVNLGDEPTRLGYVQGFSLGYGALRTGMGVANMAVGINALASTTDQSEYNTGIGFNALTNNGDGSENTAIGAYAMVKNMTGSSNTAVGSNALQENTTGYSNTALGFLALFDNVDGSQNVAVGREAQKYGISGSYNVSVGNGSMAFNSGSNSGNAALGDSALMRIATGTNNIGIGRYGGASIIEGSNNIIIGDMTDDPFIGNDLHLAYGTGNIGIGSDLYFTSSSTNRELNIGNLLLGTLPATSTGFQLANTGTIGIGTTSPTSKFGIALNNGDTLRTAFVIASSTANSTSTLFSVSNTGSTTIANGLNITAGCYAVNGTCISTGGSSASTTLLADFNTFSNRQAFNGGFLSLASSTIGNGTQTGGLTIFGGATTTGSLNIASQEGVLINNVTAVSGSTTKNNYYFAGATTSARNFGTLNLAFGQYAMENATNTAFTNNIAIGNSALRGQQIADNGGYNNVAIGGGSLQQNSTGNSNAGVGLNTLQLNTTGSNNAAFGPYSLGNNSTGAGNTAIGSSAMSSNQTGSSNVAVGQSALPTNSTGNKNIAIGENALNNVNFGMANIGIGYLAGYGATTGYSNIFIGDNSTFADQIQTGSGNIAIGSNAYFQSVTGNRQLNIGNLVFGTLPATSTVFALPTSGTIGIGTTSPYSKFAIALNNGDTLLHSFIIASSTSNSTTTLFAIDNRGRVAIGGTASTTGVGQLSVAAGTSTVVRVGSGNLQSNGQTIIVSGSYAYVYTAQQSTALEIWDISNPSAPVRLSSTASQGPSPAFMAISGKYAYMVNGLQVNGFEIWDISNPTAPYRVSSTNTTNTANSIAIEGRYAYITDSAGMEIWDVNNPARPVRISSTPLFLNGGTVTVQGRYAYVTEGTTVFDIVDVSNPSAPRVVSSIQTLNTTPIRAVVQGKYMYINENGTTNAFEIWDISTPSSPVKMSQSTLLTNGRDIHVSGRYAYMANTGATNGFEVWDISNPRAPLRVAVHSLATTGRRITVSGRYAYMADQGTTGAFEIWDLGGAYVQQLEAGYVDTGVLTVRNGIAAMDANLWGSLTVGQSLNVNGSGNFLTFNFATSATRMLAGSTTALFATGVDTNASGISDVLSLTHFATSTSAAGMGTGLLFNDTLACSLAGCATATTTATSTARIASVLTSVSTSSPASVLAFFTKNGTGNLSEWMRLSNNGSLGLGTSTPTANLSVFKQYGQANGTLFSVASSTNATGSTNTSFLSVSSTGFGTTTLSGLNISGGATSTSNVGMNITTGCYAVNGTCLSTSGTLTGTTGQLAYFSGTNTAVGTSSLFMTDAGNVGIGTTTPATKLEIAEVSGVTALRLMNKSVGNAGWSFYNVTNGAASDFRIFEVGNNDRFTIQAGGNIGVGTSSPLSKLTIYGDAAIEGANRYLNFGATSSTAIGTNGYGFRDNNGVMEFKNAGGTWQGVTTATSGPSFSVNRNGSATSSLDAWPTAMDWTTESFDTNNNFDLTTERFTPTVPGKYLLTFSFRCSETDVSSLCGGRIQKNGTTVAQSFIAGSFASPIATVSTIVDMNGSTDYLQTVIYIDTNDSGPGDVDGTAQFTYFTGALIAPVNATAGGWQNDGTQSFLADATDFVGVGTSTPWGKLSVTANANSAIPQFVVASSSAVSLIVDARGNVGIGTSSPNSLYGGTFASNGPIYVGGASTTATSTFQGNVHVLGNLKIGASSVYLSETGINFTNGSAFSLGNGTTNALSVSNTGFGTTTLTGLNVNGSATSTSNVGMNITTGCYAVNGTCVTGSAPLTGTTGQLAYFSGTNTAVGTSSLFMTGAGNVGIGTTTPYSKFAIAINNGDTLTNAFLIASSTSNSTSTLFSIDNKGRVGIGANPVTVSSQLSVLAGSTTLTRISSTTIPTTGSGITLAGRLAIISNTSTFEIWDVSTATPKRLSTSNSAQTIRSIVVQGQYMYSAAFSGQPAFEIWDISNPTLPLRMSASSLNQNGGGIAVQGRYAYFSDGGLATNGFEIWDISNPGAPVRMSQRTLAQTGGSIAVQGKYAYLADSGGSGNAFEIWDVSNPSNPRQVSQSTLNAAGSRIAVQGNFAYITSGTAATGLEIWDISNPLVPVRVSSSALQTTPREIQIQGRYVYLLDQGTTNAFEVWDVSDPVTPARVSLRSTAQTGQALAVSGRYAYTVESGTLEIWDIGGAYIQQLEVGGLEAGTLSLRNNLSAVQGSFSGGLNIGHSLLVGGPASFVAASSSATATTSIFSVTTASSTNPYLIVLGNGSVGIGTSSPLANFSIQGNYGSTNSNLFSIASSTNSTGTTNTSFMVVGNTGRVGIGSTTPYAKLSIQANSGETNPVLFQIASSTTLGTTALFSVANTGDVTIRGATTSAATLEVNGNIYSSGTSWATTTPQSGINDAWQAVAYGNDTWVAVGNNGDKVMTSPDGLNWTTRSALGDDDLWNGLAYGNGLFVAVADTGDRVMTSPDGINWTRRTAAGDNDTWLDVTYGNGIFVAVGNSGDRVITSYDGVNWTARSAGGDNDAWAAVTYGNGLFVAVGDTGGSDKVMTSPDGITWTTQAAAGNDDNWTNVTYGNGLFVAVGGATDRVMTSPNGTTWTVRSAAGNNDSWMDVTYGNGLFVVVGATGGVDKVITSPDGTNWTIRPAAGDNDDWNSVAYANGTFVAVAGFSSDAVMTSGKQSYVTVVGNNKFHGAWSFTDSLIVGSTTVTSSASTTFTIFKPYGSSNTTLFSISSSTNATGTSNVSLFSIASNGQVTGSNGMNITSGCYAVGGTCIGYVKRLAGIYATSSIQSNATITFGVAAARSGTWPTGNLVLPATTTEMIVELWGAGGGGGGPTGVGTAVYNAAGGGGGGYAQKLISSPSGTYFYSVGNGGGGGSYAGGSGSTGGTSNFGNGTGTGLATTSASGGGGGVTASTGGGGGTGTNGDINLSGGYGEAAQCYSDSNTYCFGGQGGAAPRGGGGGGGGTTGGAGNGFAGAPFGGGGGGGGNQDSSGTGGAGGVGGIVITVYATSSATASGNDYAEMFPVSSPGIGAADIVAVDAGAPISMKLAQKGDTLAGIIATEPGQLLGSIGATGMRPVALMGRVPTKVNMEGGPINIGDRIAISSVPGVGKKASIFDESVGIAIDNYATTSPDSIGSVMVFLNLQDGVDVNAIAFKLLGKDAALAIASTSATSTDGQVDFVGGIMHAFTSRISSWTTGATTSSQLASAATSTDSFTSGFMSGMFEKITEWFASAANGINKFFAKEVNTDKLCIGDTCVTESELKVLLQTANAGSSQPSGEASAPSDTGDASSTPPVETGDASSTPDQVPPPADDAAPDAPENATPPADEQTPPPVVESTP